MNFQETVMFCYENDEFVKQYNRLTNSDLKQIKKPLDFEIDVQTGKLSDDLKKFVDFVFDTVWLRVERWKIVLYYITILYL